MAVMQHLDKLVTQIPSDRPQGPSAQLRALKGFQLLCVK